MDSTKTYGSAPIPERDKMQGREMLRPVPGPASSGGQEPFVTVPVEAKKAAEPRIQAQPETVQPLVDAARVRFYDMRQIGRCDDPRQADRSRTFYRQAMFMEDYDDDYRGSAAFASYFPYYQQMSYEQLRTYFAWRTRVREGKVEGTSLSYVFLHLYELLHNVGAETPKDGLDNLMAFWTAYRAHDPVIDRYVLPWLKDYHIVYPLPVPFADFAGAHGLRQHYPAIFCYSSGREDSFGLFAGISDYAIKKSIFYTEQTKQLVEDCFYFVLTRLREAFGAKKRIFEDFVFYLQTRKSKWAPFDKALFYPAFRQEDRTVRLSPREAYTCKDQSWSCKTAMLTEHGKQLVGYIMKEMESCLRAAEGFPYKLNAKLEACKAVNQSRFAEIDLSVPQLVKDGVAAYYAKNTWKAVAVDAFNLARIRQEALVIQDKLLAPEEGAGQSAPSPAAVPEPMTATAPPQGGWAALGSALSELERNALALIANRQGIAAFARERNIMPEVLVDGINEKAVDLVGDAILEMEEGVTVYGDYLEELRKLLGEGEADGE